MKVRQVIIIGVSLLLVAFLFSRILNNDKGEKEKNKDGTTLRYVETIQVNNDTLDLQITSYGRISSRHRINISAEVQGILEKGNIPLKAGADFKRGQLLFSLKNEDIKLLLQARKSNFLTLLANILPDMQIDFSERYNDWSAFFSKVEVDQPLPPLPKVSTQKEKTFLASRNILGEYYSIKSDEERLKKYNTYAPFDGSITEVFAEPGSVINPGTQIASVIQDKKVEIKIPLSIDNIHRIKEGMPVKVFSENEALQWTGEIARMGKYVDPNTQSIDVFINVNEESSAYPLYNGMYVSVRMEGEKIADAVKIPRRALVNKNQVYVVKDSLLQLHKINIEAVQGQEAIITGLQEKALVVAEPISNVQDSVKVAPIPAK